jgi:CoA:oxalate CoA-transferase
LNGKTNGPLSGVLVIDLTRVLAGPYAALLLAEMGARVIKVEPPVKGDDSRSIGPFVKTKSGGTKSGYFMSVNRGKESIALDLKAGDDRKIFEALLSRADVLVENYRGGTMQKLGYGYDALKDKYPKLIYAGVSGFGHTGPYSHRPAYDMVVQAMGGVMSLTGHPGSPPTRVGTSTGDLTAGLFATKDGHIAIAAAADHLFAIIAEVLGAPEMASDPRYKTNPLRMQHWRELHDDIEVALSSRDSAEWLGLLEKAGVPCGPLNNVAQVMADPQVLARNMIVTAEDPDIGPWRMQGNPIKLSAHEDSKTRAPAPDLDADRAAILKMLGL